MQRLNEIEHEMNYLYNKLLTLSGRNPSPNKKSTRIKHNEICSPLSSYILGRKHINYDISSTTNITEKTIDDNSLGTCSYMEGFSPIKSRKTGRNKNTFNDQVNCYRQSIWELVKEQESKTQFH